MTDYLIPGLLLGICLLALRRQEDCYSLLISGSGEGLQILKMLIPTMVMLVTAVSMLRASGAISAFSRWAEPFFSFFGIPPETAMLILVRPISGSAALAVGAELISTYGPDSFIGRTSAVMLGSTETTFYTISVYFGAAGIHRSRYTLIAALLADFTGFTAAALSVRLLM